MKPCSVLCHDDIHVHVTGTMSPVEEHNARFVGKPLRVSHESDNCCLPAGTDVILIAAEEAKEHPPFEGYPYTLLVTVKVVG